MAESLKKHLEKTSSTIKCVIVEMLAIAAKICLAVLAVPLFVVAVPAIGFAFLSSFVLHEDEVFDSILWPACVCGRMWIWLIK